MWCLPPKENAAFVCAMEDVLEVYQRPYDPEHPVVCLDETSKQLVAETRAPMRPVTVGDRLWILARVRDLRPRRIVYDTQIFLAPEARLVFEGRITGMVM